MMLACIPHHVLGFAVVCAAGIGLALGVLLGFGYGRED
jgi:hypothetical protein